MRATHAMPLQAPDLESAPMPKLLSNAETLSFIRSIMMR